MNKLIEIEGADRRGKNSQARLLTKVLSGFLISYPNYERITGGLIRSALTKSVIDLERSLFGDYSKGEPPFIEHQMYSETWDKTKLNSYFFQCLQMLCRLEDQALIKEKLQYHHVIADRYLTSALQYGAVDGCDKNWLYNFLQCIYQPDLVIILDGPVFSREEVADVNETNIEFGNKIRQSYLDFHKNSMGYNTRLVRTVESENKWESIYWTHSEILNNVNKFLGSNYIPLDIKTIKNILN